jgi:hypothetical protein
MIYQSWLKHLCHWQLQLIIYNLDSVTGISPFNENIFPDSEFSGSYVTDKSISYSHDDAIPSTSNETASPSTSLTKPADSMIEAPIPALQDYVSPPTIIKSAGPSTCHISPHNSQSNVTEAPVPPSQDDASSFIGQDAVSWPSHSGLPDTTC